MSFRSRISKFALVAVLGLAATAGVALVLERDADASPGGAFQLLTCGTCSGQHPFPSGFTPLLPSFATHAAAQAAIDDGSLLNDLIRDTAEQLNIRCKTCPEGGNCFWIPHASFPTPPEGLISSWTYHNETFGDYTVYDVMLVIPEGSKVWVCCEPVCW